MRVTRTMYCGYPDRARRSNHAPPFNARSTAATVFASAPRPTRTVAPSISTSMTPTASSRRRLCGFPRLRRGVGIGDSTTAGTNSGAFGAVLSAASRACRYPHSCCGDKPCRRATGQTDSSPIKLSATIRALSSSLQVRRRPAPVNTSIRRTGSEIALCSVSILSLTVQIQIRPQTHITAVNAKSGIKRPLTH